MLWNQRAGKFRYSEISMSTLKCASIENYNDTVVLEWIS